MTYPAYIREKARKLRTERKLSLDQIAECLALPKTTVYYWIRDLPDPEIKYRDTPARARARAKGARLNTQRHKALRDAEYRRGIAEYPTLLLEPTFRDFVCMYIGEGYKRNRNSLALGNSDPKVVLLADYWIRRFSKNPVKYQIQYHADQDPTRLVAFWSIGLAVDPGLSPTSENRTAGRCRTVHGGAGTGSSPCVPTTLTSGPDCKRGWTTYAGGLVRLGFPRGVAQPGRAFGLGPKGRRFKSGHPDLRGAR
jgi:hypothetical protein